MENILFEGSISVKACMLAGNRKIKEIIIDQKKHDKNSNFIRNKAKELGIEVKETSLEKINEISNGKTHGGILAIGYERKYQSIEEVLSLDPSLIAILEGVEDPFNLGDALRNFYAAGFEAVLVSNRDYSSCANVLVKSSAGASEYLNIVKLDDYQHILTQLKAVRFKIVCANRKDAIEYDHYDFKDKKICLAIGGELRGLSKIIDQNSDQNVFIPYASSFRNSLTSSSSSGILAFEIARQRRQ